MIPQSSHAPSAPVSAPSAPDGPARTGRRRGPQRVMTVDRTERLGPHMVRVHLGGQAFGAFVAEADPEKIAMTDKYVKLQFAKPELGLEPPYDMDELRERLPIEDLPVSRTYTIRSIDHERRTLAIDFVIHGDEGVAGPWAMSAEPGDVVCFSGPGGGHRPSADASVPRVLLGDEAALPAIAAALEEMPRDASGVALVEVDSKADELEIASPAGVGIRWLHRSASGAGAGEALLAALRALEPVGGSPEVFAHGERETMKQVRRILQGEWGLDRRAMSLSAYWASGRAEDQFQAEKRAPEHKF